jgi:hypothetical protein
MANLRDLIAGAIPIILYPMAVLWFVSAAAQARIRLQETTHPCRIIA